MASRSNHTAAPLVAGIILQVQRALHHLSTAGAGSSVAVELIDDVSVSRGEETLIREQDKHTVRPGADLLGDRSTALWRTLQIWVEDRRKSGRFCERHLIVTNTASQGAILAAIKVAGNSEGGLDKALAAMRVAAAKRSNSKVQTIIDDVMSESEAVLLDLIKCIEIVEDYDPNSARREIANGFGIDPGVDADHVLDAMLGWLINNLQQQWQRKEPGMVSRETCLRQRRAIEDGLARRRLLPRPASDLSVGAADRAKAKARPFVDHLVRIEAPDDDVFQAIDHFLQFNIERHRLAAEGEVPFREWDDRSERLKLRWRGVRRKVELLHSHHAAPERGQLILAETTYQHYEPLGGESCHELYMTSGHYHRLADDSVVWWDPLYSAE